MGATDGGEPVTYSSSRVRVRRSRASSLLLERWRCFQGVDNVDLKSTDAKLWTRGVTYGDVFLKDEESCRL